MVNALGAEGAPANQGATNATAVQNATTVKTNVSPYATWMLILIVLILVLFALSPLMYNMNKAHQHLQRTDAALDKYLEYSKDKLDDDKVLLIIKEYLNVDPGGAPGTARGTMALTIILVVGICLFFLLTYPPNGSDGIVKDVILTLTGALTSIVGFYFGGNGSTTPKSTEPIPSGSQKPESESALPQKVRKSERYKIKEGFTHQDKQYPEGTLMDLADIPEETLKDWIKTNKIEFYVGETVENVEKDLIAKDQKPKPGWYRVKSNFRYNDDRYIAGNIINLNNISARLLAGWEKRGWIERYSGSVAVPEAKKS
ncbi:MAG: hypothetical protein WAW52_13860 [Methanothrix sp.]